MYFVLIDIFVRLEKLSSILIGEEKEESEESSDDSEQDSDQESGMILNLSFDIHTSNHLKKYSFIPSQRRQYFRVY